MINESDLGRELTVAVAERITAEYPATAVEIRDGGSFQGTVATFTPRNRHGARLTLYAAYDWSFDIHAGRFILFDSEVMEKTEAQQIDLVVEAILEVAREGISRSLFARLISFGIDRVGSWDKQ